MASGAFKIRFRRNWKRLFWKGNSRTSFLTVGLFSANFICITFLAPRSFWKYSLFSGILSKSRKLRSSPMCGTTRARQLIQEVWDGGGHWAWPLEARRNLFPDWLWLCDESSPHRRALDIHVQILVGKYKLEFLPTVILN